jgi:hypothetical protein
MNGLDGSDCGVIVVLCRYFSRGTTETLSRRADVLPEMRTEGYRYAITFGKYNDLFSTKREPVFMLSATSKIFQCSAVHLGIQLDAGFLSR